MDHSTIGTILGYVATSLVIGVGGLMAARRKMSRDGVELTKDRSEISIIELLTKQRDEAITGNQDTTEKLKASITEKIACMEEIAKLKQDIEKLNQNLKLMNQLVKRLSGALDYTKSELKKIVDEQKKKQEEAQQQPPTGNQGEGAE